MRRLQVALLLLLLCGCAGISRKCSSSCAGAVGADWNVVQMDGFGRVMQTAEKQQITPRLAAEVLAVEEVIGSMTDRGWI